MARSALTAWILLAVGSTLAGTFTLSWNGDQYTLVAQEASLHDVLNEIDRMTHALHDLQAPFEKTISATYRDVSLETILDELGVQYHRGGIRPAACAYHRRNALTEGSTEQGLDQETEAYIRKLIRYLEDDDIEFNAIHAYKRLPRLGCAARPFLEQALYSNDLQLRYAAADLLRQGGCRHAEISDRLIEVTFTGLDEDINRSGLLHTIGINAGFSLFQRADVYARVRNRILTNLESDLPRTRLYSSLLAAYHGEKAYLPQLFLTAHRLPTLRGLLGPPGSRARSVRTCSGSPVPRNQYTTRHFRHASCCLPRLINGSTFRS